MGETRKDKLQLIIRRFFLIITDIILINGSVILSLVMRFNVDFSAIEPQYIDSFKDTWIPFTIITLIIFWCFRMYHSLWQYASIAELYKIVEACIVAEGVHICLTAVTGEMLPRACYFMTGVFLVVAMCASRFMYRMLRTVIQEYRHTSEQVKIMIIGAGEAANVLMREIANSRYLDNSKVVCIIDDDAKKVGKYIRGVKIVGNRNQIKEYAMLRMQMMPYWYTEFARYHFDGIPPFRAINLEPGFNPEQIITSELKTSNLEDNPYLEAIAKEIKDQYMAGEYLLVAPMFAGQTERTVMLPKGNWYDFYTGKYVGNGERITVSPGLDRIPVFVKDGAIIPFMEAALHAPKAGQKINLEIRHYGKADGAYRLYDDDGETFDYEKGVYSWRDIKVTRDKKGRLHGTISKAEKGKPNSIATVTWKFMTQE